MKKLTSLQVLMLMSCALGSSYVSADYSAKHNKSQNKNCSKKDAQLIVMTNEEQVVMEDMVYAAKVRMEKEMGKIPTEHSIKKFINSVVEEFRMSSKDEQAIEDALYKLSDARIAVRNLSKKLEVVDTHRIASGHVHSLKKKLQDACDEIKGNKKANMKRESCKGRMHTDSMIIVDDVDNNPEENVDVIAIEEME